MSAFEESKVLSLPITSIVTPAETTTTTEQKGLPLFGCYFKVAYYLQVVPFQLKYNIERKWWTLQTSKVHWAVCLILMWIPSIIFTALLLLQQFIAFGKLSKRSANSYFQICFNTLNALRALSSLYIVGCHKEEMESIINSWSKMFSINYNGRRNETKFQITAAPGHNSSNIISATVKRAQFYFYIVGVVYSTMILSNILALFNGAYNSPIEVFQSRMPDAREAFFLPLPDNFNSTVDKLEFSTENVVTGILYYWGFISLETVGFISEIVLMVQYPLAMWIATKCFDDFVYHKEGYKALNRCEASDLEVTDIVDKYEELKKFSTSLNTSWGKINFMWQLATFVRTMGWFKFYNKDVWNLSRILSLLTPLLQTISHVTAIVFSADVFAQMDNFKQWLISSENWFQFWLSDRRRQIERMYLDLGDNPVGVACNGLYHCSYGFIAQLLAFMITIFVVTFDSE